MGAGWAVARKQEWVQLFNRRAIGYALDCNGCGADLCTCGIHIVFFGGGDFFVFVLLSTHVERFSVSRMRDFFNWK